MTNQEQQQQQQRDAVETTTTTTEMMLSEPLLLDHRGNEFRARQQDMDDDADDYCDDGRSKGCASCCYNDSSDDDDDVDNDKDDDDNDSDDAWWVSFWDVISIRCLVPAFLLFQFRIAYAAHEEGTDGLPWILVVTSIVLFAVAGDLYRRTLVLMDSQQQQQQAQDDDDDDKIVTKQPPSLREGWIMLLPELFMNTILTLVLFGMVIMAYRFLMYDTLFMACVAAAGNIYLLTKTTNRTIRSKGKMGSKNSKSKSTKQNKEGSSARKTEASGGSEEAGNDAMVLIQVV